MGGGGADNFTTVLGTCSSLYWSFNADPQSALSDSNEVWGFLISAVRMLHFSKDWLKFIKIHHLRLLISLKALVYYTTHVLYQNPNLTMYVGEFRNVLNFRLTLFLEQKVVIDDPKAHRSLPNLATTNVCKEDTTCTCSNRNHIERSRLYQKKHLLNKIHYTILSTYLVDQFEFLVEISKGNISIFENINTSHSY